MTVRSGYNFSLPKIRCQMSHPFGVGLRVDVVGTVYTLYKPLFSRWKFNKLAFDTTSLGQIKEFI